jgi:hypothetical protein
VISEHPRIDLHGVARFLEADDLLYERGAAQVRILSPLDPSTMPSVLLSTNDEQDRVAKTLANAGVAVATDMRHATLILTARLGTRHGTNNKCGGIRNVVYELSQRGGLVAVVKARGRTGTCTPNILDAMSGELAALVQGRGSIPP